MPRSTDSTHIPVGSHGKDNRAEYSGGVFLLDIGQVKMEKNINVIVGN